MPVVTFRADELSRVIGKTVPAAELGELLPQMGGDLAGRDGEELTLEWFPNRPDLLTLEGTGRAARAFLGVHPGMSTYAVAKARTELRVEAAVAQVRPYAALCFVRGVNVDERYLQLLIDAQEKLTLSAGRKRKKVAIGIHDAAGVKGPFTYTCVGPSEKPFIALNETRSLTPAQLLSEHPKGQEYGHLIPLSGAAIDRKFPVFLDAAGQVISMPPIINAQRTAVTTKSRDILIDVTGTDSAAVRATIALIAANLAEHGGTIEAVTVHDASGSWTCPDLKPKELALHLDDVKATLGIDASAEIVAKALQRMGHGAEPFGNKVLVQSPPWRFDLLHAVDLIEDVAIGLGYEHFLGRLPQAATFGAAVPSHGLESALRQILAGLGWHEAKSLTLSNPKEQWTAWGEAPGRAVLLHNPVLAEQTLLRVKLAPSLLNILAANRHRSLPQRLFEVGYVVLQDKDGSWRNRLRLACVETAAKTGFSEVKGLVEAVVRDAKLDCKLRSGAVPGLVAGRSGTLEAKGVTVGWFGEVHPDTVVAFALAAPATMLEIDVQAFW